ncbi:hypothetical protein, partial [Acinetobacter sp.]|tara:strand:+ start:929 stop:1267 length:339 start_codon:yes stop_codon:yes gene_type:complete
MRSFEEYWNEHGDVYAMEIAENAWDYQQSKVDELQKQLIDQGQRFNEQSQRIKDLEHKNDGLQNRVDAAKYYMKNIFSGDSEVDQCHWGDLLDILDGKIVRELEQALKVGES